jgi:hypothetical protein
VPSTYRCLEKVIGPVLGHHLACYTIRGGDGHYAYAKVCDAAPADVWDTPGALAKVSAGPYAEPEAALVAVVSRARQRLEQRALADAVASGFVVLGP